MSTFFCPLRLRPMAATLALAALFAATPAGAQAPPATAVAVATAAAPSVSDTQGERAASAPTAVPRIHLTTGHSTVLPTDFDVTRVAITDPGIADGLVVQPREILIDGKSPGTVSLILWGNNNIRRDYELVIEAPVTPLQQQLQLLFPGEDIRVATEGDATVLSGHASSHNVMLRAAEIAQAASDKRRVINMLEVPGGSESQQVMLQVRFAEVDRRALLQAGVSLFTGPGGYKNWTGRTTTEQFGAPNFSGGSSGSGAGSVSDSVGQLTFSDFLNLFVFNSKYNVGALLQALKTKGLLQSLAEPNLIAYNGQEASFLAGGEIPIPVVQGVTGTVTIVFKEFGIRLTFKPTIAGDTIRLHVRPEVSSLDFTNALAIQGFRIPALTTRRAETEVELRDGQSFAIAGLLDNTAQLDRAQVPGLGSIPILGYLFKSRADSADRTELMVLITPHLVSPLNPDEVPPLPTDPKAFLPRTPAGKAPDGGLVDAPATAPPPKKPIKK